MAYLYRRRNGRIEIREAHTTPSGPRSRTLVGFRGTLTDALLDQAESAAERPFDRSAVIERAGALGIPVERSRADAAARELIGRIGQRQPLDPRLATLLQQRLDGVETVPIPDELEDVLDWIGASDLERGRALRDLLRLYDTIARSREPAARPTRLRFPRIPTDLGERSAS